MTNRPPTDEGWTEHRARQAIRDREALADRLHHVIALILGEQCPEIRIRYATADEDAGTLALDWTTYWRGEEMALGEAVVPISALWDDTWAEDWLRARDAALAAAQVLAAAEKAERIEKTEREALARLKAKYDATAAKGDDHA